MREPDLWQCVAEQCGTVFLRDTGSTKPRRKGMLLIPTRHYGEYCEITITEPDNVLLDKPRCADYLEQVHVSRAYYDKKRVQAKTRNQAVRVLGRQLGTGDLVDAQAASQLRVAPRDTYLFFSACRTRLSVTCRMRLGGTGGRTYSNVRAKLNVVMPRTSQTAPIGATCSPGPGETARANAASAGRREVSPAARKL